MPVALHTHSWYSLLEAVPSPEALLTRAAACGYTALALTDTNNLYGAVAFTELARRQGIRPLLGQMRSDWIRTRFSGYRPFAAHVNPETSAPSRWPGSAAPCAGDP